MGEKRLVEWAGPHLPGPAGRDGRRTTSQMQLTHSVSNLNDLVLSVSYEKRDDGLFATRRIKQDNILYAFEGYHKELRTALHAPSLGSGVVRSPALRKIWQATESS